MKKSKQYTKKIELIEDLYTFDDQLVAKAGHICKGKFCDHPDTIHNVMVYPNNGTIYRKCIDISKVKILE